MIRASSTSSIISASSNTNNIKDTLTKDGPTFYNSAATIVMMSEVLAQPESMIGQTVRVLGRLKDYNVHKNIVQAEYKGQCMSIDTTLLGIFDYKLGSLYQWIGELASFTGHGGIILHARILRNMDELDTALFEDTLKLRRAIMAQDQLN
ncbi:hypothetical protein BATDEDRAFT_90687 [Batrachochytrium dendrobatidis JAM81]|uniref:CST complex subunit Ten1 n=2 Tax=Batrachochytrium dendrobatidis TaxID=109871 RepID=F4P7T1_BATDJ|nr:uncharacterized protein BATDEDRAFT_90687 [Batrachochytrium dendrobatidis JAM81]EGF78528.1 hypothetical protein BATDEDRAFT_90687 [Batrachochytrium dendrobatidis JAM81]KAJ8323965.1 hypothetical protein O5D80_007187 [Batrachochytrium dendrobatidis]KAK5664768.1 hypothetical protein QVD99_008313 [Batrachochytrium dendrobatidis]OAJ43658.1 hypothetical protein BDEG_26999 [Batrachochytrium dendrobatidis JEL423]|eukprot:XP_006680873.1 hypothetical protein BATDEDRAFT_90687 [Batrachochytrium dendrobatidis JAM81]